ncbi:DNA translocase FtsK 4TM domain-containing protein [Rhodocaloribacter litoris]|uniref:DNA translocase FtsK 4TM domain-containing protein n=1 Tax=Rhodocaloribacter litoris TaxID=2558931 RepID=UPI001E658F84|nr:DNA translocase FtsK 4TM domain-containing protein [Rhodocaloribacter litoris]
MASSARRKKRGAARNNTKAGRLPQQRKKEVLGLILMGLGVLLALAVLTYNPADDGLARRFSFDALLHPGENRAQNALGLIGAALARLLVPQALGYTVLIPTGLLFAWGYVLFRNRTPVYLPTLTALLGVSTFVLACLFGWLGQTLSTDLLRWGGGWGIGAAGWMQQVFGSAGSFILIFLFLVVTALLLVDHDIQRSMDRVEEFVRALGARLEAWRTQARTRREARRAERHRLREERRAAREQARAAREAARAKSPPPKPVPAPSPPPEPPPAARPAQAPETDRPVSPPPPPAPNARRRNPRPPTNPRPPSSNSRSVPASKRKRPTSSKTWRTPTPRRSPSRCPASTCSTRPTRTTSRSTITNSRRTSASSWTSSPRTTSRSPASTPSSGRR